MLLSRPARQKHTRVQYNMMHHARALTGLEGASIPEPWYTEISKTQTGRCCSTWRHSEVTLMGFSDSGMMKYRIKIKRRLFNSFLLFEPVVQYIITLYYSTIVPGEQNQGAATK